MGTGFSKQKKQAKMLQEQLSKMQEEFKSSEVTAEAGNGLVSITLNGDHDLLKIRIKKECVDPDDIEGLEDLIKEAYNKAAKQLKDIPMPNIAGMPNMSGFGF
jgi:DNA-binding YbaB/EbfC family protein